MPPKKQRKPWPGRLWEKVALPDERGCMLWLGHVDRAGYGRINRETGSKLAHRATYELAYGDVPDGLDLDHLCRVRNCVRPDHLDPVTRQINRDRGLLPLMKGIKTHCPQGHAYEGDNVKYTPAGHKYCRRCKREKALAWYQKQRAS